MTKIKMLILETGLFEDAEMLRETLAGLPGTSSVSLHADKMKDADWDRLLEKILAADMIITI